MTEPTHRSSLGTAIVCKDAKAEIEWLQKALGFELTLLLTDDDGNVGHSEMSFGDGYIMVGNEWADFTQAPSSVGGANTQTVHIQLSEDIDAHCRRAREGGAVILMEPEDQFYGDRTYRARDPEGHVWTFSQTVREVPESEWEAASGLKVAHSL
jgi:uncharacterized glyoxalase superfamily protein PhnB